MTECVHKLQNECISVATIYSPAKRRYLPHIVRLDNKQLRVTESSFRQWLDQDGNLINIHDVIADSGMQLTLHNIVGTNNWQFSDPLGLADEQGETLIGL